MQYQIITGSDRAASERDGTQSSDIRFGSGPTKLPVSTTSPVIPQLPTCERTSIGAALCQEETFLRHPAGIEPSDRVA